ATLIREYSFERAASQRVGAGVEQGWASLAATAGKVDPEPCHSGCERLAAFGEERWHLLGRRDVGVVFGVDEGGGEVGGVFAPLFEAGDTVAHAGMANSVSPRGTGAAGLKDIYGRCGSLGIVCAIPAGAIGTAVEARAFAARVGSA